MDSIFDNLDNNYPTAFFITFFIVLIMSFVIKFFRWIKKKRLLKKYNLLKNEMKIVK